MNDIVLLVGWFALLFSLSVGASYALVKFKGGFKRPVSLAPDTPLLMSSPGGSYRSRFLMATSEGWVVAAPLQRDAFVPLRVGESMVVQAPAPGGVWTFRTEVLDRQMEGHLIVLSAPAKPHLVDRRGDKRDQRVRGEEVMLNGVPSELLDISSHGAAVLSAAPLANGDGILLAMQGLEFEARGWALECAPLRHADGRRNVRICFSEPIPKNRERKKLPNQRVGELR